MMLLGMDTVFFGVMGMALDMDLALRRQTLDKDLTVLGMTSLGKLKKQTIAIKLKWMLREVVTRKLLLLSLDQLAQMLLTLMSLVPNQLHLKLKLGGMNRATRSRKEEGNGTKYGTDERTY